MFPVFYRGISLGDWIFSRILRGLVCILENGKVDERNRRMVFCCTCSVGGEYLKTDAEGFSWFAVRNATDTISCYLEWRKLKSSRDAF